MKPRSPSSEREVRAVFEFAATRRVLDHPKAKGAERLNEDLIVGQMRDEFLATIPVNLKVFKPKRAHARSPRVPLRAAILFAPESQRTTTGNLRVSVELNLLADTTAVEDE